MVWLPPSSRLARNLNPTLHPSFSLPPPPKVAAAVMRSVDPRIDPLRSGGPGLEYDQIAALLAGPASGAAAAPNAGPPNAGPPNAGPPNAGPPNAGPPNAGPPNAGPPNAGLPNAGPPNAGLPNAGPPGAAAGGGEAGPAPGRLARKPSLKSPAERKAAKARKDFEARQAAHEVIDPLGG